MTWQTKEKERLKALLVAKNTDKVLTLKELDSEIDRVYELGVLAGRESDGTK